MWSHLSPNPPLQRTGLLFISLRKCSKAFQIVSNNQGMEDCLFSRLLYSSGWGVNKENSKCLGMFSEVTPNKQGENRPWGKIWFNYASEKKKNMPQFLSLFPSSATTSWWHSDVKGTSAKSQIKLWQNWTPHRKQSIQFSLAGHSWKTSMKINVKSYFPKYKGFCIQNFLLSKLYS